MATSGEGGRRAGRRPGATVTREVIEATGRRLFARQGYDRTSLREIAEAAGVDPGLIVHYFGTKQRLFVSVTGPPFEPAAIVGRIVDGDRAGAGARLARFVVEQLDRDASRERLLGLIRAAATDADAATMVRDLVGRDLFGAVTAGIGLPDAPTRAALIGAQVVGVVVARYVVGIEPLASMPSAALEAFLADVLQRLLVEPLPVADGPGTEVPG